MPSILPIEEVLPELRTALQTRNELVLEAPPGAGKTTRVPLALVEETWLAGKKILMLEPRRLATRAAAYHMANLLAESPGQTVGYRMRLDTKVGPATKIEVITEGILTRMLQQDPSLEDVGLVIFDEFHERNLDSDLALALCLNGRSLFRDVHDPLKVLVMSATVDGPKVAAMLNDAPLVRTEGKQYPVDVIYAGAQSPRERIVERTVATVVRALKENPHSSVLVFLPGQGEIKRAHDALAANLVDNRFREVQLRPLYGNLSIEEQQMAIAPGEQKVVLATNIAETSLTIEGVDVVVDSGLVREPVFDPATGMTRLHTRKISRSSSVQRMGRAGRLRPGRCYRLWSAGQQQQLAPHISPEILQADLAPLALQLLQWGVDDPANLSWLDPPAAGPWNQALDLLDSLGAVSRTREGLTLTRHGQSMSSLAVHPRIAHMLLSAVSLGVTQVAVALAAVLSDRDPFSDENPDMGHRVSVLLGEESCPARHRGWLNRTRRLCSQFEGDITRLGIAEDPTPVDLTREWIIAYLLASAYPDRIARRRHAGGFQMANGRSARFASAHALGNARWLAVGETGGMARSKGDTIRSAAILDGKIFDSLLAHLIDEETIVDWDKKARRFVAERRRSIGALVIDSDKLAHVPVEAKRRVLLEQVRDTHLDVLPWTKELRQWQARVQLLRSVTGDASWPDVSNEGLLLNLSDWLGPYLDPISKLSDFRQLDLMKILHARLPWPLPQQLAELAPVRLEVPSGSMIAIDYNRSPPVLAVKLQEMFGCSETPSIAEGKVKLLLHLLSPAGRPLQITGDLAGFWLSSYAEVKKEMKGRYPKHPWPDDPLLALPTSRTKQRS